MLALSRTTTAKVTEFTPQCPFRWLLVRWPYGRPAFQLGSRIPAHSVFCCVSRRLPHRARRQDSMRRAPVMIGEPTTATSDRAAHWAICHRSPMPSSVREGTASHIVGGPKPGGRSQCVLNPAVIYNKPRAVVKQ